MKGYPFRIIPAGTVCKIILSAATACLLLYGCSKDKKDDNLLPAPTLADIVFRVPEGWPAPVYNFENNKLTVSGFKLGRKLFFDPRLSRDNSISCGTCHQPFAAFAQVDHDVSHGVEDRLGTRNSPALFNLNWHSSFFWDGGVNHLEVQPASPITNPVEMDETLDNVVAKVRADPGYRTMFKEAFGNDTVNTQRIFKALAQFMGMLVSSGSKYDKYKKGEATLTAQEQAGLTVFAAHCSSCHKEPLFTDFSFRNNGLQLIPNTGGQIDSGRGRIPPYEAASLYTFKVPSLRNLKYTAPYMHDGRFTTLTQVLDHYASGIYRESPNLDPLLSEGLPLSEQDKKDLIAFLNTLNDEAFITDIRFQEVK